MMKRLLSILITALLVGVVLSPIVMADNDRKGQKVKVETKPKRGWSNRDLPPDMNVYYFQDEDRLELICHETKETSAYILTSDGEEFSYDTFYSDMTPYYSIEAPDTPGTYWIVIDSPVIYGEGYFIVK